jgi:hypothetical protein
VRACVLCVVLVAAAARADPRFDHRGSLGLLAGATFENKTQIDDSGWRYGPDLGGTLAVGVNGNEVTAWLRAGFGGKAPDWSLTGGYRGYFGYERVKTFFDLGAAVHLTPSLSVGPRVGFGVQFELTQLVGVYLGLAGQIGFGPASLRMDGELISGFQIRSYVFE